MLRATQLGRTAAQQLSLYPGKTSSVPFDKGGAGAPRSELTEVGGGGGGGAGLERVYLSPQTSSSLLHLGSQAQTRSHEENTPASPSSDSLSARDLQSPGAEPRDSLKSFSPSP